MGWEPYVGYLALLATAHISEFQNGLSVVVLSEMFR
jgi:hypothetical protein